MNESGRSTLGGIGDIIKRMEDRRPASGRDHLEHAEILGRLLAEIDGVGIKDGVLLRDGVGPVEQSYWKKTCAAYAFLLGVDLEEALASEAAPSRPR